MLALSHLAGRLATTTAGARCSRDLVYRPDGSALPRRRCLVLRAGPGRRAGDGARDSTGCSSTRCARSPRNCAPGAMRVDSRAPSGTLVRRLL
jgi:hypothetical protein